MPRLKAIYWLALVLASSVAPSLAGRVVADAQGAIRLGDASAWTPFGCRLEPIEEGLTLRGLGSQATIQRSIEAPAGAAVLEFSMRCRLPASEHYVSWNVAGGRDWKSFRRIPVVVDGQWHVYRLPLNADGQLVALRFAFSPDEASQVELRDVRVSTLPSDLAASGAPIVVRAGPLNLSFDPTERRFEVLDRRTSRRWVSEPLVAWAAIEGVQDDSSNGIELSLRNRFSGSAVRMRCEPSADDSVRFTIEPEASSDPLEGLESLTPRFSTDLENGKLVFCDRSCGVLLDQQDPTYASWPLRVYGNTHCLDMPWIGVYDAERGDGLMVLFETPADAEVELAPDDRGRHWPAPRWLASRDRFGPSRTVSLHFLAEGGYVALAKRYRAFLKEAGRLKRLVEKANERPAVGRLPGAAVIWTHDRNWGDLREAHSLGVRRAVVSNLRKPEHVAWLKERGGLVGRYDSYSDIFQGPVGFQRDDIESSAIRGRPGAEPLDGWTMDDGRQMAWRSTALWMRASRAYAADQIERTGHNARFVDVAVASKLDEDWAPEHAYDRGRDLQLRRELIRYLQGFGLALGTEHGNDWAADLVDYHEGSLSGPFWWSSWEAGRLQRPTREQLTAEYLKFGMGPASRVPLWQLVFQDCLVSTWYWGDTAGMLYEAAPELADRKDLFTMLYGGVPLLWLAEPSKGYGWAENKWRWLRTYHDTTHFHAKVAFAEMFSHEFVGGDPELQRTRFAGGATATVNFSDEPRLVPGDEGLTLAPRGYRLLADGFRQEKFWEKGEAVTRIDATGFWMRESKSHREEAAASYRGRVMLFESEGGAWRAAGEPGAEWSVDAGAIAGWAAGTPYAVYAIESGERAGLVTRGASGERVTLPTSAEGWAYALVPATPDATAVAPIEGAKR